MNAVDTDTLCQRMQEFISFDDIVTIGNAPRTFD